MEGLGQSVGREFRALVDVAIVVLIVTGTVLIFHRLTADFVGLSYVAVLTAKIVLALYTFYLVRFLRRGHYPEEAPAHANRLHRFGSICTGTTAILIIGAVIFLLADVLHTLVENGLKR